MHTPIKTIRVAPAPAKIHPPKPIRNEIGKCQHGIYWPDHQDRPHGCSFCRPEVDADFLKDRRDVMKQAKTFVMPRILHSENQPFANVHDPSRCPQCQSQIHVEEPDGTWTCAECGEVWKGRSYE